VEIANGATTASGAGARSGNGILVVPDSQCIAVRYLLLLSPGGSQRLALSHEPELGWGPDGTLAAHQAWLSSADLASGKLRQRVLLASAAAALQLHRALDADTEELSSAAQRIERAGCVASLGLLLCDC
jgi:hypothetical protein